MLQELFNEEDVFNVLKQEMALNVVDSNSQIDFISVPLHKAKREIAYAISLFV